MTLAQQFNAGVCGAELDVGRVALREVLNVTSSSPAPVPAVAIDDRALTYRFDLRNPGWNRALRVSGVDFDDGWEAVIAASR